MHAPPTPPASKTGRAGGAVTTRHPGFCTRFRYERRLPPTLALWGIQRGSHGHYSRTPIKSTSAAVIPRQHADGVGLFINTGVSINDQANRQA
jgi:hypothetical protein